MKDDFGTLTLTPQMTIAARAKTRARSSPTTVGPTKLAPFGCWYRTGQHATGTYTLSVRRGILVATDLPPGGLGPSRVPGEVRDIKVTIPTATGQEVSWNAPDETETGAQWITEFHIYGSATEAGCDGYLLDEYVVEHPGFSRQPPKVKSGSEIARMYFKDVSVGPARFGISAVNELGEGPCVEGPDPPPPSEKPTVADGPPGLAPNAPNPFNASTLIPYRLDALGPVRLEIYNLLGQPVRTLVDQVQAAGAYQVPWDARDGRGGAVAAGVYLVRLHYPGGVQTQRMLYLK